MWGLGVSRDAKSGDVRLYYSVWQQPGLRQTTTWNALPKTRSAIRCGRCSSGRTAISRGDVRREFLVPDFFETADDIARAGYSQPVSDITFPACSNRGIMLVAERGGMRNLGLG